MASAETAARLGGHDGIERFLAAERTAKAAASVADDSKKKMEL